MNTQGSNASLNGKQHERSIESIFVEAGIEVMSHGIWLKRSQPKNVLVTGLPYKKPILYEDGSNLRGYVEYAYVDSSGKMTIIEVKSQGGGGSKIEGLSYTLHDAVPEWLKSADVILVLHYFVARDGDAGWDRTSKAYIKWAKSFKYDSVNKFVSMTMEEAIAHVPSIIK